MILLVNVLIISLVGNYGGSVQTLSKVGSTGEEVRQIQTKLKEYGVYSGEAVSYTHLDVYKRQVPLVHLWIQCTMTGHDSSRIAPFGNPRI